jgi:hypothetical protein
LGVIGRKFDLRENIFDDIGWTGDSARVLQVLSGASDINYEHNTLARAAYVNSAVNVDGGPAPRFRYRNNLILHGAYGIIGSGMGVGNSSMAYYFPGASFQANALIGDASMASLYSSYPGFSFPASASEVGFSSLAAGDFRLTVASPFRGRATDGRDLGADAEAVQNAMAAAIAGRGR